MEISQKTKLNDLMSKYPFIKDFLMALDPHFKALNSPLMMKTLGRVATLGKVSMVAGFDLEKLMTSIAGEIKAKTGEDIVIKTDDGPETEATPEKRIEILKSIIKDLHKGVDKKILILRFQELIKDIDASEIANMEQKLMAEGMPPEEIKRLCDVHVEVFKGALDKKVMPGLPAGHPAHTFMLENRAAEGIIAEIEMLHDISREREQLATLLSDLSAIDLHYIRKENQLFPILEAKGISGPSKVMWALHDDIRAMLKDVKTKTLNATIKPLELKTLLHMLKDMIYKEEHILFPMTLDALGEEDWTRVKSGEEEVGYAWIKPVKEWEPSKGTIPQELLSNKIGSLNLDTGQLTAEQVNLLLTHLPVDVSFVNEKDEVIYYSQTPERIFPRSPGIIGRKVQNCHPPKSLDIVEKILNEFKAGKKDSSEFWIQMGGKFIHIRYFAVRDSEGSYKGTLEVSQDVTDIRKLQGEQRLLNWD